MHLQVSARRAAGPPSTRCSTSRRRWWPSRCPTPASASRRRSRRSSSRPSSRPMPAPPASTAAPGWAWPSAASCPTCSAARSSSGARPGWAAPSPSTCRSATSARRARSASRRALGVRGAGGPPRSGWSTSTPEPVPDDRADLQPGDLSLLVVEDDPHYARVLADLAREQGFKVLIATRGTEALELAREFSPRRGLARRLPPRHAGVDGAQSPEAGRGAASHPGADGDPGREPAARPVARRVLLRHQAGHHRGAGLGDREAARVHQPRDGGGCSSSRTTTSSGPASRSSWPTTTSTSSPPEPVPEAMEILEQERVDCMVLDLRLPDISGFEVLAAIRDRGTLPDLPVVVFTGRELTPDEDRQLQELARNVVLKGVESPERLLDETSIFLHRVVSDLPAHKQRMLEKLHRSDEDLRGTQGPGGGRRRAKHLRPGQRARAARDGRPHRPDRPGGHLAAREPPPTWRWC